MAGSVPIWRLGRLRWSRRTGTRRPDRGPGRPSRTLAPLTCDQRASDVNELMRPLERAGIEEHAQGLLIRGGPDGDPAGGRAAQFDPDVADRHEVELLEARSWPALDAVTGDDQAAARQEHRRADAAKDDEQLFMRREARIRRPADGPFVLADGRSRRSSAALRSRQQVLVLRCRAERGTAGWE